MQFYIVMHFSWRANLCVSDGGGSAQICDLIWILQQQTCHDHHITKTYTHHCWSSEWDPTPSLSDGVYTVAAVANVCHFPAYLRRATLPPTKTPGATGDQSSMPTDSQWVTELRYSALTAHVQSRLDIVVFDSELMAKVSFAVECPPESGSGTAQPCYQTELVYRRSCVDRLSDDKFKVLHNEGL